MNTASISAARSLDERRTVRVAAGIILDGTLQSAARTEYDVERGGLMAVGMEYRVKEGLGKAPSIDLSGYFGASWTKTTASDTGDQVDYFASDLRLGASFGWSLVEETYSYLATRVFGGPVDWEIDGESVTGTDTHHYQLGLGSAARFGPVAVFAEWYGLGEKSISAGMSATW